MRNFQTEYDIGSTRVLLNIDFSYVRGAQPTWGPNGGDPGWPPEIDVYKIEWRQASDPIPAGKQIKWHEIGGELATLIADDLYEELCDAAEMEEV